MTSIPAPHYAGLSDNMRRLAQLRAAGYRVVDDQERPGWVWLVRGNLTQPFPSLAAAHAAAVHGCALAEVDRLNLTQLNGTRKD